MSGYSLRKLLVCLFVLVGSAFTLAQQSNSTVMDDSLLFLDSNRDNWTDWNVPYEDGKILHDWIVTAGAKNILEIGTSTGHSTVWLARAAAQTGGRVITIEIDPRRYDIALKNFEKAGVADLIEANLGDAHRFVPALNRQFDFAFSDADKDWYIQYFKDISPKLNQGACLATHNVLRNGGSEIQRFLDYVNDVPGFTTRIVSGSGEGISFSCKKSQ